MATRKSGDDAPQAPESKVEQRPGSYAQISGSRRKRKGKKQRNSRASNPPVDARALAEASEQGERSHDSAEIDSAASKASVPVDDLRAGRPVASTRAARRALGPLGMAEQGVAAPPPSEPSGPRAKLPSQPRVKVVEINPAELAVEPPSSDRAPAPADAASASASPVAVVDESVALAVRMPSQPPAPTRPTDPPESRPAQRRSEPPPRVPSLAPTWGADELALAELEQAQLADELQRPFLSSVFDARPSLRPSPAPAPEKSSPAFVLVVSLLCAIIAAAGVVALREALDETPPPHAPRTATSAPSRGPDAPARPQAESAAAALTEPSFEPKPGLPAASDQASITKADASVAQLPVRRPVRVSRPAIANSPAPTPAGAETPAPSDALPDNPYNDPPP